jgi:hypothetical protein
VFMAYANFSDLEVRFRALTDVEQARAEVLLEDASVMLDSELTRHGKTADDVSKTALTAVCCAMVKRVIANGFDGDYTQMSRTAGSFNEQFTFANPSGDMYIRDAERLMLGLTKRPVRAWSVMPKIGDD